jgi:dihydroorotase
LTHDLILAGGRILDPANGFDGVADVAFSGGRVAAIGSDLGPARETRDVSGRIVAPGLIDLHTHVYWGGTSLGIDPDAFCRRNGVTTSVDTGSAGPGNFAGFRKHVIEAAESRVLAFLHVSFAGIFGFGRKVMVGEAHDMRLMAPEDTLEIARANRDVVVGIKVRIGRNAGGASGIAPLEIALQVADAAGLPVMCHIDFPPPNYADVCAMLRRGDVLTHAFRPFPNAPIDGAGRILKQVHEARARGVIFDIGHGMGSFAFATGRAMLAQGFMPDVISSDVHALSIEGPAFDLTTTMSKFLCLGMPLADVVRASTSAPATAVRRPDLGVFAPGAAGDATILEIESGSFDYVDAVGERLVGDRRISSRGVVIAGRWWHGEG